MRKKEEKRDQNNSAFHTHGSRILSVWKSFQVEIFLHGRITAEGVKRTHICVHLFKNTSNQRRQKT